MMALYIFLGVVFALMVLMVSVTLGVAISYIAYVIMNHMGIDDFTRRLIAISIFIVSSAWIFDFIENLIIG